MLPNTQLVVFVATRRQDVPAGCTRFVSVDGSVPGAEATWDHHLTGEAINLDAMPDRFDMSGFDGVGTTAADTDAVASVVAVMFGGKANLAAGALEVLASASYRCDHLRPHPGLSAEVNELGRGLHGFVVARLRSGGDDALASVSRELATAIAAGDPLPYSTGEQDAQRRAARRLEEDGRIYVVGKVGVVDLRGSERLDPEVVYERLSCPVSVFVEDHRLGGLRYTVGVNPCVHGGVKTLRLALERLAAAEFAHGLPAELERPGPGSENWGGRETVFGSPWNYGSRLAVDEVVGVVAAAIRTC